jgi:hypothetical protein
MAGQPYCMVFDVRNLGHGIDENKAPVVLM